MSQWTDRIAHHPVFTEFAALGPIIDRATARWGIDAATLTAIERLRSVLTYCGKRIATADPDLVDPRPLAVVAKALASVRAELEAYATDSSATHVDIANTHADDALAGISSVPGALAPDDLTWINESASAYRSTIEKHLQETLAKHAEIFAAAEANRAALTDISADLAATKQKLATILSEQQTQFSGLQDTRATEFATAQTERQSKYATALSEFQTIFSDAQNERLAKFASAIAENQAQFSTAQDDRGRDFVTAQAERTAAYTALSTEYTTNLNEHNQELTRLRATAAKAADDALATIKVTYEDSAKKVLEQIEAHKTQVEKLVGVIGNLGVTSGYQKIANRAQNAAYLWQFLTVAALSGLIYVAYVIAFASPTSESLFLQGLSTRIFLSLTVGVFAAYAAKQAANNLTTERRHRKLALELEALGPFIAPLPAEMQEKFRAQLGDRSFGIPDEETTKVPEKDPVTATDLIPLLRDLIGKLGK